MNRIKIAVYIFFTLTLISFFSCKKEANLSPQMEEVFYIRNGGSDMPAWVHGNGASKVLIIMLHGGPSGNSLVYRRSEAFQEMEEKYAMVYWDQRHQGNAHGHLTKEEVTIDLMVEDLNLLVRTLKKRYGEDNSIFLMGHSWGGKLGTAFLIEEDYQNHIKGWINIDGALDAKKEAIQVIDMVNSIGQDELDTGNGVSFWTEFIDHSNSIDTNSINLEKYLSLNRRCHIAESHLSQLAEVPDNLSGIDGVSPHSTINAKITGLRLDGFFLEKEYFPINLIPHLKKITIPSLLIWGKYDFVVPPKTGQIAYEGIGSTDKELKIYESSAHSPMNFEPDRFVMDVSEFVEENK